MAGFAGLGLGKIRGFAGVLVITGLATLLAADMATADIVPVPPDLNDELYVQENFNVTGTRAPFRDSNGALIYNNGQLARQENEPSCGINPLNPLNRLCAFNWYGFSDRPEHGDAWIGFSESMDGRTFKRRPLTGYNAHKNPIGKEFAADPTMLVFPGGAMVTFIAGDRAGNSVMVVQRMMEVNREYGFRHVSEERLITIEALGGVHFIDKPDAQILIDPNGGFSEVTMTLEEPVDDDNDPSTPPVTEIVRQWPNFRIVVSFADFGGSGENIRTWSTYSDDFGLTWSNKRQISNTSGLDQGLSIENKGDDLLYVFRRFDSGENRASIMGALSRDRGDRIGKVFEITDICDFDMITSPSAENPDRSSVRSNAFPWLSATDTHFVLAYVERPRDGADGLTGNCLNTYVDNPPGDTEVFDGVAGTRVVIRTSTDGKNWSAPIPVMPFNTNRKPWVDEPDPSATFPPVHFNFMPTLDCARGSCNVIYYSTLTESQTYEKLAKDPARPWEKTGFVEDFSVGDSKYYRRFLDIFSSKIKILHGNGNGPGTPVLSPHPERVSKYQLDFDDDGDPDTPCLDASKCKPFEKEWNPANILNYGGNSKPFIGDYIALAAEEWRKENGIWVDNASPVGGLPNIGAAINQPSYFAAWTDNRRVRVFYNDDGSPLPYAVPDGTLFVEHDMDETGEDFSENSEEQVVAELSSTKEPWVQAVERTMAETRPDRFLSAYAYMARGEEDDNDPTKVGLCQPQATPNVTVQTRVKDAEIYGALIEDWSSLDNRVRLVSPAAAKNYLNSEGQVIQRGFVIGAQNIDPDEPRPLALIIKNQPPSGRASWRQLPIDPDSTESPDLDEFILAERLSTEYLTLFVISEADEPVTVAAYDYFPPATEGEPGTIGTTVVDEITVDGRSEAGDLWDPGTLQGLSVLDSEIHNPFLIEPDWANLEVNELNPNFKNPNFKNPNFKNPNFKNTDYMDPNFKNPNFKNPNFKNTTVESTNLQNPNFKNPNFKNTAPVDGFIDVTYQVVSLNNTTTATNADFAYGGDELDGLDIEVIAWQADELDSLQDCDPEFDPDLDPAAITESKVVAAKSLAPNFKNPNFKNPNFKNLAPADIADPFQGFVSFPLSPAGTINTTVRIFCVRDLAFDPDVDPFSDPPVFPARGSCEDLIFQTPNPLFNPDHPSCSGADPDPQVCDEPTLNDGKLQNKLGYNFWAQKANTGETQITNGREQLIKDVIPPSFNFPNDHVFVAEADSSSGANVNLETGDGIGGVAIGASDDGTAISVECSLLTEPVQGMPATAPLGETTDAACASDADASGNIGIWTGFVRVVDTTEPSIKAPANISDFEATGVTTTVSADDCNAGRLGFPTVDDLTGTPTYDCGAPLSLSLGPNTVTWTATDASGNSATATQTVTVVDTTPPGITAPADISNFEATGVTTTVSADDCSAGRLGFPTVDDLTGTPTYDCGAPLSLSLGPNTVTWTATDTSGNSMTASQTVTVVDTTPPGITAPASTSITATGTPTAVLDCTVLGTPIVDDLTGTPTYDCGAPLSLSLGENTVTWTATDASGNSATATQTVTVVDTTPPVITAPADISDFEANADPTHIMDCSLLGTPTLSDETGTPTSDCDAPTIDFALGTNIVTWTADDGNGNTATDTQIVTIVDTTDPVITVPDGVTEMATSSSGAAVTFPVTAEDIFRPVTIACFDEHGAPIPSAGGDLFQGDFALGSTEVECTATDPNGNPQTLPSATATGTFVVTVKFEYGTTGIGGFKQNAKTGTSIPTFFAWTIDDVNQDVGAGNQVMTVRVGACPGTIEAQSPGNSGFQLLPDLSYQRNFQAVDDAGDDLCATRAGTTYCLTVTVINDLIPFPGQSQSGNLVLKGTDSSCP